ncbi:MAG TPA: hypothetical protein VFJ77_09600 [Gaiellaceae bacterium]|nr:hypothetical protein [Gaiellaceae bacterium]
MTRYLLASAASALAVSPQLAVTPSTAAPGALVRIHGNAGACPAGDTVTAISSAFPGHAYGKGALTGRVRAHGAFSFTGHLRKGAKPGRYAVTARCGGGNLGVVAHVRVR